MDDPAGAADAAQPAFVISRGLLPSPIALTAATSLNAAPIAHGSADRTWAGSAVGLPTASLVALVVGARCLNRLRARALRGGRPAASGARRQPRAAAVARRAWKSNEPGTGEFMRKVGRSREAEAGDGESMMELQRQADSFRDVNHKYRPSEEDEFEEEVEDSQDAGPWSNGRIQPKKTELPSWDQQPDVMQEAEDLLALIKDVDGVPAPAAASPAADSPTAALPKAPSPTAASPAATPADKVKAAMEAAAKYKSAAAAAASSGDNSSGDKGEAKTGASAAFAAAAKYKIKSAMDGFAAGKQHLRTQDRRLEAENIDQEWTAWDHLEDPDGFRLDREVKAEKTGFVPMESDKDLPDLRELTPVERADLVDSMTKKALIMMGAGEVKEAKAMLAKAARIGEIFQQIQKEEGWTPRKKRRRKATHDQKSEEMLNQIHREMHPEDFSKVLGGTAKQSWFLHGKAPTFNDGQTMLGL